jgi:hypothetical protein
MAEHKTKERKPFMTELLELLKHPAIFVGSLVGAFICLIQAIYYAIPGVYHVSLGHSHPPLDPKLDYMAGLLVLAVICGAIAVLSYRARRAR